MVIGFVMKFSLPIKVYFVSYLRPNKINMKYIIGIIPARYASTRLPGKPLVDIDGKPMIQRVYEQAMKVETLTDVYVATDDERIAEVVKKFHGKVVLTSPHHQSGTDRCAEVLAGIKGNVDVVINIQGDEPFIDPLQIQLVADCFKDESVGIASLIKKMQKESDVQNPNMVKAVKDAQGNALFFSRSPIPYRRNPEAEITYYKHIGIYGYTAKVLAEITQLPQGNLEKAESLEQLRWLESGYKIRLHETELEALSVDTPDDLIKAIEFLRKNK